VGHSAADLLAEEGAIEDVILSMTQADAPASPKDCKQHRLLPENPQG